MRNSSLCIHIDSTIVNEIVYNSREIVSIHLYCKTRLLLITSKWTRVEILEVVKAIAMDGRKDGETKETIHQDLRFIKDF